MAYSMVRSIPLLVAVLSVGACDRVFGLDGRQPIDAGFELCAPLTYDPDRYLDVYSKQGLTWMAARDRCKTDALDLAVLDIGDDIELANQLSGATHPFWLGVSYTDQWSAIDGCSPFLAWGASEPMHEEPTFCVLATALGMVSERCSASSFGGELIGALCETPRPTAECLAMQSTYTVSPVAVDYATAKTMCAAAGMHLVELNSSQELDDVRAVAGQVASFWLGAEYANQTWASPTQCPEVYPWTGNGPTHGAMRDCVIFDWSMSGAYTAVCNAELAAVVCEQSSPG